MHHVRRARGSPSRKLGIPNSLIDSMIRARNQVGRSILSRTRSVQPDETPLTKTFFIPAKSQSATALNFRIELARSGGVLYLNHDGSGCGNTTVMSAPVSKSLTTIERKSASLTQDAVMAFDFEDRLDRVGGFGLAVVFVQIKAERAVADLSLIHI